MKHLILFLSLVFSYVASADPHQSVMENCINHKDWSKVSCNYEYDPEFSEGGDAVGRVVGHVTKDGFGGISQAAWDIVHYVGTAGEKTKGTKRRKEVINLLSSYIGNKKLSTCQKTCLVKCASANILKYDDMDFYSKYGSVEASYNCEKGSCTEFSNLFDDLAYQFGIRSRVQNSMKMGHSFNKVKIDNDWVYVEPQDASCTLYTAHNPKATKQTKIKLSDAKKESYSVKSDNIKVKPRVNAAKPLKKQTYKKSANKQ